MVAVWQNIFLLRCGLHDRLPSGKRRVRQSVCQNTHLAEISGCTYLASTTNYHLGKSLKLFLVVLNQEPKAQECNSHRAKELTKFYRRFESLSGTRVWCDVQADVDRRQQQRDQEVYWHCGFLRTDQGRCEEFCGNWRHFWWKSLPWGDWSKASGVPARCSHLPKRSNEVSPEI